MEYKDFEELLEMANELNAKKIEKNKDKLLEGVTKQIRNCKRAFVSASEEGTIISGSGINVLATLSLIAHDLKTKTNLEDDMIRNAVEVGLQGVPEEKVDSDIQELLEKFKEIMED